MALSHLFIFNLLSASNDGDFERGVKLFLLMLYLSRFNFDVFHLLILSIFVLSFVLLVVACDLLVELSHCTLDSGCVYTAEQPLAFVRTTQISRTLTWYSVFAFDQAFTLKGSSSSTNESVVSA